MQNHIAATRNKGKERTQGQRKIPGKLETRTEQKEFYSQHHHLLPDLVHQPLRREPVQGNPLLTKVIKKNVNKNMQNKINKQQSCYTRIEWYIHFD